MTNRKSYNSILFLTVYLGLVLVGGSSHVFAHAATNSLFDLRNEIEFKEDLDNKPDGNPNLQDIDIAGAVADFLKNLQKLQTDKPEIYKSEKNFFGIREIAISPDNTFELKKQNEISVLDKSFEKLFDSLDSKQLRSLADFVETDGKLSKQISYKIFPSLDFCANLIITFKKDSPEKVSYQIDLLNAEFAHRAYKTKEIFVKQVYENTKAISSNNNQVFIVTRLPRASIDSLLK